MNQKALTITVSFLAGGLVTFLLTQKMLKEKYALIAAEDSEEVREFYRQRKITVVSSTSSLLTAMEENGATDDELSFVATMIDKYQPPEPDPEEDAENHYRDMKDAIGYAAIRGAGGRNEQAKRDYSLRYRQPRQEKITRDEEPEDEVNPPRDDDSIDPETPYVIDENSYNDEFLDNDKIELVYYADDQTLTEEDETIVTNPTDLVGIDTLDMRNTGVNHPYTIYVRNERLRADYEILIQNDSYQRVVMGIDPNASPRQQQEQRMKRREPKDNE